jgi:hypothetical protein
MEIMTRLMECYHSGPLLRNHAAQPRGPGLMAEVASSADKGNHGRPLSVDQ